MTRSTRRWAAVAVGIALLVAAGVVSRPAKRMMAQRSVGEEAKMAYPGSVLVAERWEDEEHVRYIDTGGADNPAGWRREYRLPTPVDITALLDHYERALRAGGWDIARRQDRDPAKGWSNPGGISATRRGHELEVRVALGYEDFQAGRRGVRSYEVDYRLPYRRPPRY